MRKKIKFIIALLCISFGIILAGCEAEKPVDTPPKDIDSTIKLSKIEASSTENEVGYLNEEYAPNYVAIYAVYTDGNKIDVTSESSFTTDTSKIGTSSVIVTYKEFKTSYVIRVVEDKMESISVDYSAATILFQTGDSLDTSGIRLTGKYLSGKEETISHYRIELLCEGKNASDLSLPGNYVVKVLVDVSNQTLSTSYNIVVTGEAVKEKIYTRIELDKTHVQTSFENKGFSTDGLKVYGVIDANTKELISQNNYTVSLYYQSNKLNEFEGSGEYLVTITYTGTIECVNASASYYVTYKERMFDTVHPNIIVLSATEASVEIPLKGSVAELDIVITDGDGESKSIEELNSTLTGLNVDKNYSISGSYLTVIEDKETVIELIPAIFSTALYSFCEQIDEEEVVDQIAANFIAINIKQFEENVPTGYQLAGFEVLNENGDIIQDIKYSEELEGSLYITGLESETKYLVRPYYESAGMLLSARKNYSNNRIRPSYGTSMAELNTRETTYTYRIRFVGYWYLTSSEVLHRVRMRYNDTTLYTWYVGSDHHYTNERFCTFILPIELDDYYIVGCSTDLSIVEADVDAELILALKENPNGTFTVAFYGFKDVLLDVQEVQAGDSAVAPNVDETIVWQGQKYTFKGFNKTFTNVSENLSVYAQYVLVPVLKIPRVSLSINVGSTSLSYHLQILDSASVKATSQVIKDSTGVDLNKEVTKLSYYIYLVDGLTPSTSYKYVLTIKYDINDGNGEQEIIEEIDFITGTNEVAEGITGSVTKETYCDIYLQLKKDDTALNEFIYYSQDGLSFYSANGCFNRSYDLFCLNSCAPGMVYFYYRIKDSTYPNVYHMQNTGLSYEVPQFGKPKFSEIRLYLGIEYDEENPNIFGDVLFMQGENLEGLHFNAIFNYYVEEIMSSQPYLMEYRWVEKNEEFGNVFVSGMVLSPWLEEVHKYEGHLDSLMQIEYLLNGVTEVDWIPFNLHFVTKN